MPESDKKSESAAPPEAEQLEAVSENSSSNTDPSSPLAPESTNQDSKSPASPKPGKGNFFQSRLLYVWLFGLVVTVAGVVIFVTLRWGNETATSSTKTQKLTASQLASLSSNTTVVGDSQQTLSVQSNAIFQGQVLLRQSLEVAGSIKLGSGLTVPSINVGNTGNFGQLQVNDTLSVAGDTTVQGQLTVQKNLTVVGATSFASLSVSQLSVTTLQLNGDLNLNKHIVSGGGIPSKSNGSAIGSGGTASNSGNDVAGTVTIGTGSSPAAGCFLSISFVQKYNSVPHVILSPANSSAAVLEYYADRSTTGFSVCTASAPASGTNYIYDYLVAQ